jgi:CBS domain-containing protein
MAAGAAAHSLATMRESLKAVSDVMRCGVVSVSRSTSLEAVARVMCEHDVRGVLVVGGDGAPLGWVTARGLLAQHAADWRRVAAGQAISEPCVRVVPSASVASAIDTLLGSQASRLAVMRPGSRTPDGVVSEGDLVAHLSH